MSNDLTANDLARMLNALVRACPTSPIALLSPQTKDAMKRSGRYPYICYHDTWTTPGQSIPRHCLLDGSAYIVECVCGRSSRVPKKVFEDHELGTPWLCAACTEGRPGILLQGSRKRK